PRASASLAVSVAPAIHPPPRSPLFPYTTLFRSLVQFGAFVQVGDGIEGLVHISEMSAHHVDAPEQVVTPGEELWVKIIDLDLQRDRKSTRLNSSHVKISYAVFCLKKKNILTNIP